MIAIAITAITLSTAAYALFGIGSFVRERDYAHALQNAHHQMETIRKIPFEDLPPFVATVGPKGQLSLNLQNVEKASLTVSHLDTQESITVETLEPEAGTISLKPEHAGQKVIVNYRQLLPDRGEAHFLSDDQTLTLLNQPLIKVDRVAIAQGSVLIPTQEFESLPNGRLKVSGAQPGDLVLVDYQGERLRSRLSSEFVDIDFRVSSTPTSTKQLTLSEKYGGAWNFQLTLIREKP